MLRLSQNAASKVEEFRTRQNRPESALRVAVLGGDCAGLKYFIGLDDFRASDDIAIESLGKLIYTDVTSAPYLWGSIIDWAEVEDDAGFIIFNPNKGRSAGGCSNDGSGQGCMTRGDGNTCQKKSGGCSDGGCGCASKKDLIQIAV